MDTKKNKSRHNYGFNKLIATQREMGGSFFVPSKIVAMILSCLRHTRSIYLLKTDHSAKKSVQFTNFFFKFKWYDCQYSKCHKNRFNNNFRDISENLNNFFTFLKEFMMPFVCYLCKLYCVVRYLLYHRANTFHNIHLRWRKSICNHIVDP